jgi:hypothetical protein
MATQPEPNPDPTEEPTEMDNLRDLATKLLQVPKSEVEELHRQQQSDTD